MPKNGYWIECIPLSSDLGGSIPDLYTASMSSFPEVRVTADSPDIAIDRLRSKLRAIRRYYRIMGKVLPEMDNPVKPPSRLRSVQGWISVYVQVCENQNYGSSFNSSGVSSL